MIKLPGKWKGIDFEQSPFKNHIATYIKEGFSEEGLASAVILLTQGDSLGYALVAEIFLLNEPNRRWGAENGWEQLLPPLLSRSKKEIHSPSFKLQASYPCYNHEVAVEILGRHGKEPDDISQLVNYLEKVQDWTAFHHGMERVLVRNRKAHPKRGTGG